MTDNILPVTVILAQVDISLKGVWRRPFNIIMGANFF